jgi:hypothetical protein
VSNTTDAMNQRVCEAGKVLALEDRMRPEYEHLHRESVAYVLQANPETCGQLASLEPDADLATTALTAGRFRGVDRPTFLERVRVRDPEFSAPWAAVVREPVPAQRVESAMGSLS